MKEDILLTNSSGTSRGLQNLGNTCYLNSLLHVLARVECIRIWLSQHQGVHHDGGSEPTCIVCKLIDDINDLTATGNMQPLRPRIVLSRASWNPAFANVSQQDASEGWMSLLNALDTVDVRRLEALELHVKPRSTPFWYLCGGSQTISLHCRSCNSVSHLVEPLAALELQLQKPYELNSLDEAMLYHLGEEHIEGTHEACMAMNCLWKTTTLSSPPFVLSITLKRWDNNWEKIQRHISFPAVWPLTHEHIYTLRGVVEHRGDAGVGHYVSYIRCLADDWHFCNDFVPPWRCSLEDVLQAQAYMLIYERA